MVVIQNAHARSLMAQPTKFCFMLPFYVHKYLGDVINNTWLPIRRIDMTCKVREEIGVNN